MTYIGDFQAGETINAYFSTNDQSGAAVTITSSAGRVYKNNTTSYESATVTVDVDSQTGFHSVNIDTTTASSFYAADSDFAIVVSGTVDSQSVRAVVGRFSIQKRSSTPKMVTQDLGVLEQAAGTSVAIGPFIDRMTGVPLTSLTPSNITCKLINGTSSTTLTLTASGGTNDLTHIANGIFALELTASNTNHMGNSVLVLQDDDVFVPYTGSYVTMRTQSYQSLISDDDTLEVDVTRIGGSTVTSSSGVLAVNSTQISGSSAAADSLEAAMDTSNNLIAANVERIDDSATSATNLSDYTDGTSNQPVDVTKISGDATAADRLEAMMDACETFNVDNTAFTPTTTAFETSATEATTDHYKDRIVLFVTGPLAGQQKACTAYTLSGGRGKFTVDALTEAPASGNLFILV
tara:strand:- start:1934 stop:3154 length:1221 start_codon:yes stop_codon:yes gene_type:complete